MLSDDVICEILILSATGIIGWLWNVLWRKIVAAEGANDTLEAKLSSLEVKLASDYVRIEHLLEFERSLFARLDRWEDKIDRAVERMYDAKNKPSHD